MKKLNFEYVVKTILYDVGLLLSIFLIGKYSKNLYWFLNFFLGSIYILHCVCNLLFLTKNKKMIKYFVKEIIKENKFYDAYNFIVNVGCIGLFLYFDFKFLTVVGCMYYALINIVQKEVREKGE